MENYKTTFEAENEDDILQTVELPSKGKLYPNGTSEIQIDYMTASDENLLSTPELIRKGTVMDELLKRKIKSDGIKPSELLNGDKDKIILQLRASSYGQFYDVKVTCPETGNEFEESIDLLTLNEKELSVEPDEMMEFSYTLPMSKKTVKFKLLSSGEFDRVLDAAQKQKEAYKAQVSETITLLLKAQIKEVDGNRDRNFVNKFIDRMRAGDSSAIRKYIKSIEPGIDYEYELTSPFTGNKFKATLNFGIDFFYPSAI
jgi:hypothetical protein